MIREALGQVWDQGQGHAEERTIIVRYKPATAVATSSGDNRENSVKDVPGETGLYVGGDDRSRFQMWRRGHKFDLVQEKAESSSALTRSHSQAR